MRFTLSGRLSDDWVVPVAMGPLYKKGLGSMNIPSCVITIILSKRILHLGCGTQARSRFALSNLFLYGATDTTDTIRIRIIGPCMILVLRSLKIPSSGKKGSTGAPGGNLLSEIK